MDETVVTEMCEVGTIHYRAEFAKRIHEIRKEVAPPEAAIPDSDTGSKQGRDQSEEHPESEAPTDDEIAPVPEGKPNKNKNKNNQPKPKSEPKSAAAKKAAAKKAAAAKAAAAKAAAKKAAAKKAAAKKAAAKNKGNKRPRNEPKQ